MPSALDTGNVTAGREPPVESRRRVVIVDDDALFRESLGLNLVENGYEIDDFGDGDAGAAYIRGKLELRNDINRAIYDAKRVDLTLTEFQIVRLLANADDTDVSYRQIYDLVRGKDFIAGYGEEGYRVNVRSFIKRIR